MEEVAGLVSYEKALPASGSTGTACTVQVNLLKNSDQIYIFLMEKGRSSFTDWPVFEIRQQNPWKSNTVKTRVMWRFPGRISIGTFPSEDMFSTVPTDTFGVEIAVTFLEVVIN